MNIFNFIKSHVSILDVVQHYTTLKKAGHYWKGCCPFHSEKTASFTVSPHKEIYYCFGCHTGGDVIAFITKAESCSPLEAAYYISERFNIAIPESMHVQEKQTIDKHVQEKKRYWYLCELVATILHENMLVSEAAVAYMEARGLSQDAIQLFKIGYFSPGLPFIKRIVEKANKHNYLLQDLLAAGILAESKNSLYSPFEDRIIFPITDHLGRFCGFGGRTFMAQDERPKYYNSKENSFFTKGHLLFGLSVAKRDIQHKEIVFVVEGYMDCIAMAQHGYTNTVATLGTACSLEHLKQLSRYASYVYVLYDGDAAGQSAILRLTELCWNVNMDLKVIRLPAQEDPASFLGRGNSLSPLVAQAEDIFVFFIESLGHGFLQKEIHEKASLIRNMLTIVKSVSDSLKQGLLLQKIAETCEISLDLVKKEFSNLERVNEKQPANREISEIIPDDYDLKEIPELEKKIFSVIINNIDLINPDEELYLFHYFSLPLRKVLEKLRLYKKDHVKVDFIQFFDVLDVPEKNIVSKLIIEFQHYYDRQSFDQLFVQFQKKNWKSVVHNIKNKLSQAQNEGNEEKIKHIFSDFQELKKTLKNRGLI